MIKAPLGSPISQYCAGTGLNTPAADHNFLHSAEEVCKNRMMRFFIAVLRNTLIADLYHRKPSISHALCDLESAQ